MTKNIIKLITCSLIILLHTYSFAMLTRLPQAGRLPRPTRIPTTKAPYSTQAPTPKPAEKKTGAPSGPPSGGSAVPARGSQATSSVPPAVIRPHFGSRTRSPLFEHKRKDLSMQAVKQRSQSLRESEYPASYIEDSFNTSKFTESQRENAFQTAIDLAQKEGYAIGIVYNQAENSMRYIRNLCNIAEGEAENYVPYPYVVGDTTLFECIFTPDALIYMIRPSTATTYPELIYPEGENIIELHELGLRPNIPPKAFSTLRKIQDAQAAQELQHTIETLTQQTEALQPPAIAIEPIPDVPVEISPATIEPQQPALENIETPLAQAEQPFPFKPLSQEQQAKLFQWGKPKFPQPLKPIVTPEIEILEKAIEHAPSQETQLVEAPEPTKAPTEQAELEQPIIEEEPIIIKRTESAPDQFVKILSTTVETSGLTPEARAQFQQEIASVMKKPLMGPAKKLELLKTIEKNVETLKKTTELAEQKRLDELQQQELKEAADKLNAIVKKIEPLKAKELIKHELAEVKQSLIEPAPKEPILAEKPERHLEAEMRAQELKEAADKLAAIVENIEPLKAKESIKHEIDTVKRSLAEPLSKEPILAEEPERHIEAEIRAQELKEAADKLNAIVENIEPLKTKELIKHEIDTVKRSLAEPLSKEPILAEGPERHLEAEMRAQELKEAADKLAAIVEKIEPLKTKESIKHEIDTVKRSLAEPLSKEPILAEEPEHHLEAEAARELTTASEKTQPFQFKDIQPAPEIRAQQPADILPKERISPAEKPEFHQEAEAARELTVALETTYPTGTKQNIPSPAEQIEKNLAEPTSKEPILAEEPAPHIEAEMRAQELKEAADKLASIVENIEPLNAKELIKHEIDTVKRSLAEPAPKEPSLAEEPERHLEAEIRAQELKKAADKLAAIVENIDPLKAKELIKHEIDTVKRSLAEPLSKEPILAEEPASPIEAEARQNLQEAEQNLLEKIEKQRTEITKKDAERRERPELAKKYAEQFEIPQGGDDDDDEREKEEPAEQPLPENPDQAEPKTPLHPQEPRAKETREKEIPTEQMEPTEPIEKHTPPTSKKPRKQLQTKPAEEYVSPSSAPLSHKASEDYRKATKEHMPVQGSELHGTPYTTHTVQDQRIPHFTGSPSGRTSYIPSPITHSSSLSSPGGYISEIPTPPEHTGYGEKSQPPIPETHAPQKVQDEDTILSEKGAAKSMDEMPPRKTIYRVLKDNVDFIKYLIRRKTGKPETNVAVAPEITHADESIDTKKPKQRTEPSLGEKITDFISSIQKWFGW